MSLPSKTWTGVPALALAIATLSSCGGGGDSSAPAPAPAPAPSPAPALPGNRISADSPVAAGCTGGSSGGSNSGTLYANAEVEPFAAVHPGNANVLISAWQQDRWSSGGARGLVTAVSSDAGVSWTRRLLPFSRCGGAAAGSSGDYERASDPWVDIGPSGVMYSMALGFTGTAFTPGASSALLASRSLDGGQTWSTPATLLRDGETLFNDKNALTADPTDERYVYAVWDRLESTNFGPTLLARSTDSGASWEPATIIYRPSVAAGISQTIGNRIVVLQDGTLVNLFTQIDTVGSRSSSWLGVLRSSDKGLTWSAPIRISDIQAVGAKDPQTGKAIRDGATLASIAVGPAGSLWLTWQDARFSGGLRDAILVTRSVDGGRNWTAPVAINRDPGVAAFTPTVAVNAEGQVAISHYDLRADTADATTLLASAWLLSSRDGLTWVETKIWGPFDMAQAPDARGLFLGDYQGLIGSGTGFLPVLALSSQDGNNRSDIYALRVTPVMAAAAAPTAKIMARAPTASRPEGLGEPAFRRASHEAIAALMERRVPGWEQRFKKNAGPP
ncbi:sialidase family protein [Roseateles oligotrophus]|uniref:Glycoside hydrolase n=1 Tax=Roseateles oligotrophus TaxID=1769250 RepID=A0ABT2YEZ3_9BURK|nr:sialidase family protein [Roseateles oligotrophus]MCV2368593.1 glycoside hydrolase [Roseateles oligotrophus]